MVATTGEVDKRSGLTYKEFVRSYLNPLRPVVLTDAVDGWPALRKWTPEYFRDHWGDRKVIVRGGPNHAHSDSREYTLSDLIRLVLESDSVKPAPYLYACKIDEFFPELLPDISPPLRYAFSDRLRSRFLPKHRRSPRGGIRALLIGGARTCFPEIHYDYLHVHAWVTQVCGDKEFTLWPPEQAPYLYPIEQHPNKSPIDDIENPDFERYPLFAQARALRAVVRPGETMFVPSGWWHTTRLLSTSIAVSLDTVTASNWRRFSADFCASGRDKRPLTWLAQRAYLMGAGLVLSLVESLSFGSGRH